LEENEGKTEAGKKKEQLLAKLFPKTEVFCFFVSHGLSSRSLCFHPTLFNHPVQFSHYRKILSIPPF